MVREKIEKELSTEKDNYTVLSYTCFCLLINYNIIQHRQKEHEKDGNFCIG